MIILLISLVVYVTLWLLYRATNFKKHSDTYLGCLTRDVYYFIHYVVACPLMVLPFGFVTKLYVNTRSRFK